MALSRVRSQWLGEEPSQDALASPRHIPEPRGPRPPRPPCLEAFSPGVSAAPTPSCLCSLSASWGQRFSGSFRCSSLQRSWAGTGENRERVGVSQGNFPLSLTLLKSQTSLNVG